MQPCFLILLCVLGASVVQTQGSAPRRTPVWRMNRFQYANAVEDLFERVVRECDSYFPPASAKMPGTVRP